MKATNLYSFLRENTDMMGHEKLIKKFLEDTISESWMDGYVEHIHHTKKRRVLEHKRETRLVNRLLDYIADLTYIRK